MDPNATLALIRVLVTDILTNDGVSAEDRAQAGEELAQHVDDLDEWLCKGGFFPNVWTQGIERA